MNAINIHEQQIADMIDNTLTEDERIERENAEYLH